MAGGDDELVLLDDGTDPTHVESTTLNTSVFEAPGDTGLDQLATPSLLARRLLMDIFMSIFSQEEISPGCANPFRFFPEGSEGESEGSLLIAENFVEENDPKDPRHAIIVSRTDMNTQRLAINNNRALSSNPNIKDFTTFIQSGVQISCYGQKARESEFLADLVFRITLSLRDEIKNASRLHTLTEPAMGATIKAEEGDSRGLKYVTNLNMTALFSWAWQVEKLVDADNGKVFKAANIKLILKPELLDCP